MPRKIKEIKDGKCPKHKTKRRLREIVRHGDDTKHG